MGYYNLERTYNSKIGVYNFMREIQLNVLYKNYKIVCNELGQDIKSGKSKKIQIEDWERYYKIERKGNGYIFVEKYTTPFPQIDKRKGNSGKSEGSRNNNKGSYAPLVDTLLLNYLIKQQSKTKNTYKIYTTNNKIAENIGLVNCNYRTSLQHQEKLYNTVKEDFDIESNTYCMWDSFGFIKSKLRELIKESLDRLMAKEQLEYEFCYFIMDNKYNIKEINETEYFIIYGAEESTLIEMGITKKVKDNNRNLTKEFNKKVLKKVQKELDYVKSIFQGYCIFLSCDESMDINVKECKQKLNTLMLKYLSDQPLRQLNKTIKEEKLEKWFGGRNPFWKKWTYDRMSSKYIQHCTDFMNILVNINAKDIKLNILNCNNNTIINGLTKEEKEIKMDKIYDNMLEVLGF